MDKGTIEDKLIERFARRVRSKFNIQRMLLFGSRARGDYLKHSDYDVLLVSPDFAGKRFMDRAVEVMDACDVRFALELLCYTPEEFGKMSKQICIVREAARTGIDI